MNLARDLNQFAQQQQIRPKARIDDYESNTNERRDDEVLQSVSSFITGSVPAATGAQVRCVIGSAAWHRIGGASSGL